MAPPALMGVGWLIVIGMLRVWRLLKLWLVVIVVWGETVPLVTTALMEPETKADSDVGEASSTDPRCSSPENSSSSSAERCSEPSPPSSRLWVRLCLESS